MRLAEPPVDEVDGTLFITDGSPVWAGHYLHERRHPDHTHSFVEIAITLAGAGVHRSPAGPRSLQVGDVVLLRPGAWHGYADCSDLVLYNCCFSVDLLRRSWPGAGTTRCWGTCCGPGPTRRTGGGIMSTRLGEEDLAQCLPHLDA